MRRTTVLLVAGLLPAGLAAAQAPATPTLDVVLGRVGALAVLIELLSADAARLEAARVSLELIPAGTAEPVLRLLMAAKGNDGGTLMLNQASVDTARLAPGRYTVIATPILGEKPLGRVSRVIQIDEK